MTLDKEKLEAAGFTVADADGSVMIAAPQMTVAQFVPVKDGRLQLMTQRSAFHREIAVALGDASAAQAGPPA